MRQSGGPGHRGRIPYHHCLCALSYQPAFILQSSRRIGKNSTTNPSPVVLPSFSFFLFWGAGSMSLSSLQAWVIPFSPLPYRTLLDSPGSIVSFFLWNICCSPSRDVLCCFCPLCFDLVSCTPLGIGHVLQDSSGGLRILFNAIATPLLLLLLSMTFTVYQNIYPGLS